MLLYVLAGKCDNCSQYTLVSMRKRYVSRLVAIARGEQEYFDPSGVPTAAEACKSNALMRCCKDLGIASELWDPRFIREFKATYCVEVFAEHVPTKKKYVMHTIFVGSVLMFSLGVRCGDARTNRSLSTRTKSDAIACIIENAFPCGLCYLHVHLQPIIMQSLPTNYDPET